MYYWSSLHTAQICSISRLPGFTMGQACGVPKHWSPSHVTWNYMLDHKKVGFYVPLKNISLIWRRHNCRWRAAKFRPMLGAQGLLAERDLYRATPTVTRDLGFSGLIRRTAPFSRLLRSTHEGVWRMYSNPDPHGVPQKGINAYP
jgi:hypothetical protein